MAPLTYRINTTKACDSCQRLKTRCIKEAHLDRSVKCSECIRRNVNCTYDALSKRRGPKPKNQSPDNENTHTSKHHQDDRGLSQEEIMLVTKLYGKEQLSAVLDILTSYSSLPCPYENTAGHQCHEGCTVRYTHNC
ncbi:7835_t:CDS:1 [Racocetra fulgida]|uniref:7835_t:CDS:1 n=1 Tax=Racocetra fulgida TaxID=60492 RepID=A0A9N8ZYV7_9GLOM|nr:7835_t:CDS:1 [Racocetra fulgida]